MKSIKNLVILLITALATSVGFANPPIITEKAGSQKQDCKIQKVESKSLQAIYTSQIGVKELTGHNDGVMVEKYLQSVNLSKGNPWCAAFVSWSFKQAGYSPPITGWSPTAFNKDNIVYNGQRIIKQPQPGDVFVLWFPKLKRIAHTGFYDFDINSSVYSSVEGNTNEEGSREGDGIYRKKRSYRATYRISRWV
jgi:hypothetical protein